MGKKKARKLLSIIDKLAFIGLAVAGVSLLLMVLIICTEISLRAFAMTTRLADQVAGYLLVSLIFMGQAYTLKTEGHIRIDILYSRFPEKVRYPLEISLCLVSMAFLAYYSWAAWLLTWSSYTTGTTSTQPVEILLYPIQSLMAIGFALFSLMFVHRTVRLLQKNDWRRDSRDKPKKLPDKDQGAYS